MATGAYIVATLGLLMLFGVGWLLIGRPVLWLILGDDLPRGAERRLLTLATGMAGCMVVLAALASAGWLNAGAVAVVLAVALAANLAMARRRPGAAPVRFRDGIARLQVVLHRNATAVAVVCLLSLPLLVSAVTGSFGGDSYIYHLPQARLFADSGRLAVNEHLQVPLHPHYYHLLYAVALLAWDDRLANAIHAASAALSVLGLYFLGRIWVGRGAALLACALYVAFAASIHSAPAAAVSAYVGYGTAVFTLFAYHCLGRALVDANGRMLCLACLLMGVSLGIKVQAWVGVPAFAMLAVAAVPKIRRFGPVFAAGLLAGVVGGFWYLRNFLVSGDPFHPLGGNVFGHWSWNAADLAQMHEWLDARSGLNALQWLLVAPALAMPLLARRWVGAVRGADAKAITDVVRGALALASLAGVATWVVTSSHDRFLLSIAPVVLLTSATGVATVLARAWGRWAAGLRAASATRVNRIGKRMIAMVFALVFTMVTGSLGMIVVGVVNSARCGGPFCSTVPEGIEPRRVLDEFGGTDRLRLYQLYFEHAYYYLGRDVVGGWAGPSRYRDLVDLGGDGRAIAAHLRALGGNALLVNAEVAGDDFPLSSSFLDHFAPCGSHGRAVLFVRRDALREGGADWPPPVCQDAYAGRFGTPAAHADGIGLEPL